MWQERLAELLERVREDGELSADGVAALQRALAVEVDRIAFAVLDAAAVSTRVVPSGVVRLVG
jgi:hypothetical protein